MMYHFLYPFHEHWSAFNVFRYSTFRSIYAVLTALVICLVIGPMVIRWLRRWARQPIREVLKGAGGHRKKAGTPTMGGLLIVLVLVISMALWARWDTPLMALVMFAILWFAGVGFADDYLKLRRGDGRGLSMKIKFLSQVVGACLVLAGLVWMSPDLTFAGSGSIPLTSIKIPLVKSPVDLGWGYYILAVLVIVGASNAVNLTDGLDGLAIGTVVFGAMAMCVVTYVVGHSKFSSYLGIIHVRDVSELTIVCAALVGTGLGFLWFNAHPAEVFMGDVGSLALGGVMGTIAVLAKQELLLILIGGIFVIEALSVIIQVVAYRVWGRRVFLMSPLHHHFELAGVPEAKIVVRFWIGTIVIALASLSLLKLR